MKRFVVGLGSAGGWKQYGTVLRVNYRLSSSKNFCGVNRATLGVNTSAFRFFAHGPHKDGTGRVSPRSTGGLLRLVRRGHFPYVLTRTPCALGPYSTGRSAERFTLSAVTSSLGEVRFAPGRVCGFRPNDRAKLKIRGNVRLVSYRLGEVLAGKRAAAILLRAVTKGNARINGDFSRLQRVLSHVRLDRGINIYLSAYRIFSTNCSVMGSLSRILASFSEVVNLRGLQTVRVGSDGGPLNDRGSERRYVNGNCVKLSTVGEVIARPILGRLPFCLRAPGSLSNCGTRVRLLHSFYSWAQHRLGGLCVCTGVFCGFIYAIGTFGGVNYSGFWEGRCGYVYEGPTEYVSGRCVYYRGATATSIQ